MTLLTIAWLTLPLFIGFSSYLLPRAGRFLALGVALVSFAYSLWTLLATPSLTLSLLDNFGVTLMVDAFSGFFILTNALVTAAVVFYCWQQNRSKFFYTPAIILHGCVNAILDRKSVV